MRGLEMEEKGNETHSSLVSNRLHSKIYTIKITLHD